MYPKYLDIIKWAVGHGYRYDDSGNVVGISGRFLVIRCSGKQRYPTFSVNYMGKVFGVPAHKFAGYCLWGERAFDKGLCVRHLNANTDDFSRSNLELGTYRENSLDKPREVRVAAARKARASQGYSPCNKVLSDSEERALLEDASLLENPKTGKLVGGSVDILARKYGISRAILFGARLRSKGGT